MSQPVRINVSYSAPLRKLIHADVEVVGAEDELFGSAVSRSVREQLDPNYAGTPHTVIWQDPEYPDRLHTIFPAEMTMGGAREYFGDEADASPPTIRVDEGGYGGGADFIPYFIDLVNTGMQVGGYVGATLAAQRLALKLRYGRARQLGKDWNDSDTIPPDLREAVLGQPDWLRKDFDRVFGLGPSRGPLLLRTLGYERRDGNRGEVWLRILGDDGKPWYPAHLKK